MDLMSWLWLGAAVLFGIVEALTAGLVSIWFVAGAAAGLVVQETLSDAFLEEVKAKGAYLREGIEALNLPCFGQTRGLGLMIGIAVKEGYNKSEIANKLIANGLLVLTAGPGMRLLPPLVITKEEMDKGLEIMKKTLS